MKNHSACAALLTALIFASSCAQAGRAEPVAPVQSEKGIIRAEFKISGTDCSVCLNRIRSKIAALPGVKKAVVWNWPPYFGLVVYDAKLVNWQAIEKSVADEHVKFVEMSKVNQPEESTEKPANDK